MNIKVREDNTVELEGYINVTARESKVIHENGDTFIEIVQPKVFERALNNNHIPMLLDHDWTHQIGNTKTNVELSEDNVGLHYRATIDDEKVVELARANKLNGCSFGYINEKYISTREQGFEKRYLNEFKLLEVSILSKKRPAYTGCSVYTRDDEEGKFNIQCRSFNDPEEFKESKKIDYSIYENEIWLLKNK